MESIYKFVGCKILKFSYILLEFYRIERIVISICLVGSSCYLPV